MLVKDIIGKCNTGLAKGLNLQLIAKMNRMVDKPVLVAVNHPLIDIGSDSVNAFLQPAAAAALIKAVSSQGNVLKINSCLRTTVQQHIIRTQWERGLCGITAAAKPGRSNHEQGQAIDVDRASAWRLILELRGWKKLGDWDPPHYDFWSGRGDLAKLQIFAFQALWNEHNPKDTLVVDGVYGDNTASRINQSPIAGW